MTARCKRLLRSTSDLGRSITNLMNHGSRCDLYIRRVLALLGPGLTWYTGHVFLILYTVTVPIRDGVRL